MSDETKRWDGTGVHIAIAKRHLDEWNDVTGFVSPGTSYYHELISVMCDALAEAHAAGAREAREIALEEAAVESESWFEMFKFESFALDDMRRCANPNQIAARIRALKSPTKLSDGSDQ